MHWMVIGRSLLLWLLPAMAVAGTDDEELQLEWLVKDVRMVRALREVVEAPPSRVEDWLAAVEASDVRVDRDAGFGARRLKLVRYGGYTSVWMTVLVFDGMVADFTLFQDCSKEKERAVWDAVTVEWGEAVVAADDGPRYAWRDDKVLGRARAAVRAELGAVLLRSSKLPVHVARGLKGLTNSRQFYDLGSECYYSGTPPVGREVLEELVQSGDPFPLQQALRGLNPEGRIYAAEGLMRLDRAGQALSAEDAKAIELLRALPIPLGTCSGCFVTERTAQDVLSELDL